MANNRIFLVHKPSGKRVTLGKRMGAGWYNSNDLKSQINDFFDYIESNHFETMDEMCMEYELSQERV